MKNKGPLYVLTCYVIWGLLPIFWKLLAQVDSLYVLASRIQEISGKTEAIRIASG